MFNVTILKMRDIIKYLIGIVVTITIVIVISKQFSKDSKDEEKIVNEVKNGINMLSEQSLLSCFEQAVPTMANINEEYSKVAKEDDHSKENILQGVLETQISSIKGLENIENTNETAEGNLNSPEKATIESAQNSVQETASQNIRNRRSRRKNRNNNK